MPCCIPSSTPGGGPALFEGSSPQGSGLPSRVETRSDQDDAENQGSPAHYRRNDMGGVFGGLELEVADFRDLLRLLGRKYRNREPEEAEKDQNYATNHQPIHPTHGDLRYAMPVVSGDHDDASRV